MKTISIYFVLIFSLIQTNAFSEDKEVMETTDLSEISIEYFPCDISNDTKDPFFSTLVIYDIQGNLIRQAEINGKFKEGEPGIFKQLINRSYFLNEIDGVLYYIRTN